jgi:hypothetical protein
MNNESAFDVNLAVRHWRENLGQSPAFRRENLDELELHLRDSVTTLQTRGLSAQEAFVIAAGRIGSGGALGAEFAKVNGGALLMDRILWLLAGFLLTMVSFDVARIVQSFLAVPAVVLSFLSNSGPARQFNQFTRTF